jgi:FtsH-binding integral membrane protein
LNPYDNQGQVRPTYGANDFGRERIGVGASNAFLSQVFSWMFAGLLLTGIVGWYLAQAGIAMALGGAFLFFAFAELGMVWYLSARINRLAPGTATALYLGYAALSGVTFSVIFVVYKAPDLINAFVCTSALFAVLALFGKTTSMDLRKIGTLCVAGLIAIIVAMVVNIFFLHSSAVAQFVSVIGVIIFAGLTAWDMQRLTQYSVQAYGNDAAMDSRMAILGALALYLDFINMFLFLLRLFGSGRR